MPSSPDATTLYGHWTCPYSNRVEFALAQRKIRFGQIDVPPTAVRPKGFVLPNEFVTNSPKLEIPLVRVGGEYKADSIPILEWLEEKFSSEPLLPAEGVARTLVLERVRWIDQGVATTMGGLLYASKEHRIERFSGELSEHLELIDAWLEHSEWLAGDSPSLAEAIVIPFYVRLSAMRQLGFDRPLAPRVARHHERCQELMGWHGVAWSTTQHDEFVGRFRKFRQLRRQ